MSTAPCLRKVERGTSRAPLGAVHLQGVAHGLAVVFCEFRLVSDSVEVRCPLKFIGSSAEAGFVEKPPADVVTNVSFLFRCPDCSEGFFVENGGLMPPVLTLIDLGKDQQ